MWQRRGFSILVLCLLVGRGWGAPIDDAESLQVTLSYQIPTADGSPRYHRLTREDSWAPTKTAIIVCDMWDSHHCYNAVQREKEFAPRLNEVLIAARNQGVVIIHAPSSCMEAYESTPARTRAIDAVTANDYPPEISQWCYQIPSEEKADYPIDQSDGGEDDTAEEKAAWVKHLRSEGRDINAPWKKQIDVIKIDETQDYVSDQGEEIWNVLRQQGIENVILTGVHLNMCVLGRPFGLRRMAMAGMNVALVRDLTDTMYNPAAKPFVSHFSGTDLIIDHVERHVCPTITSDQLIGGEPFRFKNDTRPHVALLISEPEYETERTLPAFAEKYLRPDFRLSFVYGSENKPNELPGIHAIDEADVLLVSVRRRTPPSEQLAVVREFVASGKPVIGIRTASHAFCLRSGELLKGASDWPQWDAEVFGGNYSNHYGSEALPVITRAAEVESHAMMAKLPNDPFTAGGSLYMVSPLGGNTTVLMNGKIDGKPSEPVAWTHKRNDGGQSFYTSLGAPEDFENPLFTELLVNALHWATN